MISGGQFAALTFRGEAVYNTVIHMTPRRKLFTVRLDDDLLEGLDAVFKRDAAQPSEQVRRALREWLERKGVLKTAKPARARRDGSP